MLLALGWYEQRVHQGIAEYALKAGWHLCADVTKEKVIPWGWEGDGILAWLESGDDLTKFVVEAKLPTVDFSYRRPELRFPACWCDHSAAAKLVAEHFLVRGFNHFMYYSAQDNWAFEENGRAFVGILKQAGHDCAWIRWHKSPAFTTGHLQWRDKRRWLAAQLKNAPKPLALFAATDDHALEIIEVCETIGLAVPEASERNRHGQFPAGRGGDAHADFERGLEFHHAWLSRRGTAGSIDARQTAAGGTHPHSAGRIDRAQEQRLAGGQSSGHCALFAVYLGKLPQAHRRGRPGQGGSDVAQRACTRRFWNTSGARRAANCTASASKTPRSCSRSPK